jgi:transcriptional regulator with XRE-family HTH domain
MNTLRLHRMGSPRLDRRSIRTPLAEGRFACGLTQKRLAEKTHLPVTRIEYLELRADARPWVHEAEAIAIALNVAPETLFPQGVRERKEYNAGPDSRATKPPYAPPPEPVFVRHYPRRDFEVMCWKCKSRVTMRTDAASQFDDDPRCPYCGAEFGDVVPLEEAARP